MEKESTRMARAKKAGWKRWLPLPVYAVVIAVVWSYKTELLAWIGSGGVSPALMLLIVTGLACIPVIPFSVVIATMGYLYGPLAGALISLTGAWLAALITYGLLRYALQNQARSLLRSYRITESWTALVERYPFRSIVLARLIPILPQLAVNAYAAAVSIPFAVYAAASFLGKIPGMFVFAFIGGRIGGDKHALLAAIGVYAGFFVLVYAGNRLWMNKVKGKLERAERAK